MSVSENLFLQAKTPCDICLREYTNEAVLNRVRIQVSSIAHERRIFHSTTDDFKRSELLATSQWKSREMVVCNDCFLGNSQILEDQFGNTPMPKEPSFIRKLLQRAFAVFQN